MRVTGCVYVWFLGGGGGGGKGGGIMCLRAALTSACIRKYHKKPLQPEYPTMPSMLPTIKAANARLQTCTMTISVFCVCRGHPMGAELGQSDNVSGALASDLIR